MAAEMNDSTLPKAHKYSILLSAYACEPGLGSEAAVGWGWAVNLARAGCRVHVLTRTSNRARIELAGSTGAYPAMEFTYFDFPQWLRFWKRGNRGVHLYYLLWQIGAYFVARRLRRNEQFDLVHHVTYVTARFPGLMGLLGLPFVYGPLAGGEYAPHALWQRLGASAVIKESMRYLSMSWWRFSPLLNLGFASAGKIFVTSRETLHRLPRHAQKKAEIMLGIAWESGEGLAPSPQSQSSGGFEILYAGRFLYWKGMEYGLAAVARLMAEHPSARLTMLGDGPAMGRWREQCRSLGIDAKVRWRQSMPRSEFLGSLAAYDAMLFPSLHDSGGMVVLEAMAAAVPVVCLDFGGPGVLVDETCGFKVKTVEAKEAIDGLHGALKRLALDRSLGLRLGNAGRRRAVEVFSRQVCVARMLSCYKDLLGR